MQPSTPGRDVVLEVSQIFSACVFCKARKIKVRPETLSHILPFKPIANQEFLRQCDGIAPACGGCTKFGRASTCSLSSVQQPHRRDYVTYLQKRIQRLKSDINRHHADPSSLANHDVDMDINSPDEEREDSNSQLPMIDALIADIGALPIIASSYPGDSSGGPSLSTVVLAAASKSLIPSDPEPPTVSEARSLLPKRSTAERLARHYITNIYPRLPFFSIQGFWAQFNHVLPETSQESNAATLGPSPVSLSSSSNQPDHGYSFFTVLIVLAIATSSLSRSSDSIISNNAEGLFRSALLFRESAILPNAITGVQSMLFLIQFATLNPSLLDAWYLIGVGMRNCIDLGLHQDPQPPREAGPSLLETRRRLWWSMYSFDRSMSLGCGRPTEIPDNVIGVELPSFRAEPPVANTDTKIAGYLQRYRILRLQSLIYDQLNAPPEEPRDDNCEGEEDEAVEVTQRLRCELEAWRRENSLLLDSRTLLDSEWHMGLMLLYRPCRLMPERTTEELMELWKSSLAFAEIYRNLVESNGIFYVHIASEKVYWTGLAILHSFWKLTRLKPKGAGLRPLDLWMATRDVTFALRTLSERWEEGKALWEHFDRTSARVIDLVEGLGQDAGSIDKVIPDEVKSFCRYSSLTSIWTASNQGGRHGGAVAGTDDETQSLIAEIVRG